MICEKLETVELRDPNNPEVIHAGLFSNYRLLPAEVPDSLFLYQVRGGDDSWLSSIEKEVLVNHEGSLLFREEIDLGPDQKIMLCFDGEDDTENFWFTGDAMTIEDFLSRGERRISKETSVGEN